MQKFNSTFTYKLIYVFSIDISSHKNLLKIGDTTIESDLPIDKLFPNCSALNKAAQARIKQYTNTAGIAHHLLHTEIAARMEQTEDGIYVLKSFRDKAVHRVLLNSGVKKVKIDDTTGTEWFKTDIITAINAIKVTKNNQKSLSLNQIPLDYSPILFRPEQKTAIAQTIKQFKASDRMLWNAKMRFGKTLCTLEVVKQMGFKRTIIATHRPVVNDGWYEDFTKIFYLENEFAYGSKSMGITISELEESCKHYVYFVSVQDLRGSDKVGGKFEKNDEVFSVDWDFVVIDEAHEGTTTSLGERVVAELVKPQSKHTTKFLALSGTPFNIVHEYRDEELYTWDYVMEQRAKQCWDETYFGDSNPYEELPKLNIFTYNLGKLLGNGHYEEIEDKAFNFKEFFRTWSGDISTDFKAMPSESSIGGFVHRQDVIGFLNLITKTDAYSHYPYATEEFRALFQHSLWMVPGVKEARALSKLLKEHTVFGNGLFDIVNVAGDGDDEEESKEALKLVKDSISAASKIGRYTITLSCGKLTTGVTVPEWTAVMMLSGSYSTSAANYLQTIFRVQSPANINGKIKENCYVFDFAPDRTLKMVADAVNLSAKAGNTSDDDRFIMGEFLNFCPVVSIDGTMMKQYNENNLLQQLKRAYAERAVRSGFDDTNLYNQIEFRKLTESDIQKFDSLKGIVNGKKSGTEKSGLVVNDQGFSEEEYQKANAAENKHKKELTDEEKALKEKLDELKSNKKKAISILRAISIRIPLLIYGAEVNFDEDISAKKLVELVDQSSWDEFMPTGVGKDLFQEFIRYYDADVFIAAGRRIKSIVKQADLLAPTERVQKLTALFKGFKNPDKETVLTPWRVVNMHMSDCLGGYDFFDEGHNETIDVPRMVDRGQVTTDAFATANAKVLEVNSKTGLYPLYIAYSIFRYKCGCIDAMPMAEQNAIWEQTVKHHVFVICKTPMAKAITTRTLLGYKTGKVNSHYFDDLVNMLKNKPTQFVDRVSKPSYWNLEGSEKVKFDAIVGNPPYQEAGGSGGTNDAPIYQHFALAANKLKPSYISLIIPSRWFSGGRENLLGDFRRTMLADRSLRKLIAYTNSHDVFPAVEIKGGLCYYLHDKNYQDDCEYTLIQGTERCTSMRTLDDFDVFIREPILADIVKKAMADEPETVDSIISNDTPFGIPTNPKGSKKNSVRVYEHSGAEHETKLFYIEKTKRKIGYVKQADIKKNMADIDKVKVFIPEAGGSGIDPHVLGKPELAGVNTICTQSYLYVAFESEMCAQNFISYLKTKFFRILVSACKISQHAMSKTYRFVPVQDFSKPWTDEELYKKYALNQDEIDFIESMIKPMK